MALSQRPPRRVRCDRRPRGAQLALLTLLALGPACLQPVDPAGHPPASPAAAELEQVERAFVQLLAGMRVRLLPAQGCLEVDGRVNMDRGPVEVFACAPGGKTHESVVLLDCVPSGLHAGLLALGLSPGGPFEHGPDGVLRPPTGDGVLIEVRWIDAAGTSQVARAEDWIWDVSEGRAMERAAWIFAGSMLVPREGRPGEANYAADVVKSLVTTLHDASAVLENPWPGGDDTRYHANIRAVPAVGTPLTVRFSPDR